MTTLRIPFEGQVAPELIVKIKNHSGVNDVTLDENNRMIVSIDSENNDLLSQILNEVSENNSKLSFTANEYPVEKMTCGGCASSAERLLTNQVGVVNAKVEFPTHSAKIIYMEDKTSPDKLKSALDMLGYDLIIK